MSKRIRLFLIATTVIGIPFTVWCVKSELISVRVGEISIGLLLCLLIPATFGVSHRKSSVIGDDR